jgi:hypothetical protein
MKLQLSGWHSMGGALVIIMEEGGDPVCPSRVPTADILSGDKSFPWPYLPASKQQKTVFIKDLGSASLFVREPIPVSVEVSEGQATACSYDLEQFGVGGDEFEALDDLRATIAELYQLLKQEPNLGPLPRRQLAYLTRALKEA